MEGKIHIFKIQFKTTHFSQLGIEVKWVGALEMA